MDIIERDEPSLDGKLAIPMFWGKVAGLTAQELRPELFDECLKLVERFLIPEEAMCVALDMKSDAASSAALLASARNCMKDGTSIVVIKGEDYVEDEDDEGEEEEPSAADAPAHNGDHRDGDPHDGAEDGKGGEEGAEASAALEKHESGDGVDPDGGQETDGDEDGSGRRRSEEGSEQQGGHDGEQQPPGHDEGQDDVDAELDSEEERRRKEKRKRRHKRRKRRRQEQEGLQQEGLQQDARSSQDAEQDEALEDAQQEQDVVDEGEQRVVAVMVARVVQRTPHMRSFSRIKVADGDVYNKWVALRCHLQKAANLFERYDVATYYRVYYIVVHPDHRNKGVGSFLVRLAAHRLAELFAGAGTLCTAVAPSRATQRLLARQGFRPHAVVHYHEWKDAQGQPVIAAAGMGNYSAVLAVLQVPARDPGEPLDVSPLVDRVEEAEQGPRPVTAFPGREQGLPRPAKPDCPPAQEEPPFGIVASGPRPPKGSQPGPGAALADGQTSTASQARSSVGSSQDSSSRAGSSSRGATGSSGASGAASSRNSSGSS